MSDLEEYIISIFKKDRIKFKREVHFKDCAGGKYRYDFEFYPFSLKFYLQLH